MKKTEIDLTPWPTTFVKKYTELGYWSGKSITSILSDSAKKHINKLALIDSKKEWTYEQLNSKAIELASGFSEIGIQSGDKIVVQLPNVGECIEVLFALFYIGAIPVMALTSHRYLELEHFCSITKAKAYITADKIDNYNYLPLARKLKDANLVSTIIIMGKGEEFKSLQNLYIKQKVFQNPDPSNIALLQLSGGTTNVPKLIPRTHNDYLYSIVESAKICALNNTSVYLCILPVTHNFSLTSPGIMGVLYSGGTVVLSESGNPDIAFSLIEKYRVTITALVPPLVLAWLNAITTNTKSLSTLQILQVGGSKLNIETAKKIEPAFNCKLQQVFGMAEGLVNYTRLNDSTNLIINTQGRPISKHDEIKIVDEADNEVAIGQPGLLLTRGPYTIRGYFRAAEHNKKAFTEDGFYRTGDIVKQTKEGYLIVDGRFKDQINRGGEKIAAAEVENQLLKHSKIIDAAVVSMPDPYLGEKSCAFVIPDSNSDCLRYPEMRRFLIAIGMANFKIPDRLECIGQFPKTFFGKVDKKQLRKIISDKLEALATS